MKIVFILISLLFFGCGGGGSAASSSSPGSQSTPNITALQGDINAIEPVDLD
tara:strand:- start:333 stop:488 length:156 start_codon:yes stop_codon:yes gene_type:complete